ncbi:hypothetical protein X546_17200 [Brevibacillus borstelensis cifa_chp40]|nr:hypothetical protein X546_17200 [Brevibacillus borstelensis cifa_chp40]
MLLPCKANRKQTGPNRVKETIRQVAAIWRYFFVIAQRTAPKQKDAGRTDNPPRHALCMFFEWFPG